MRLLDDLRLQKNIHVPQYIPRHRVAAFGKHASKMMEFINEPHLPVVLIDNVAHYYYTDSGQEYWDIVRDFPNLAPPFPGAWFEYKFPKLIHSVEKGDTPVDGKVTNGRCGWLVLATERENVTGEDIPEGTAWVLMCEAYQDFGFGRGVEGPNGTYNLAIDKNGALLDRPAIQMYAGLEHEKLMQAILGWLHPVLLAISFLHCRNVRVEDHPVPAKLAKRFRERHDGLEPAAHKTLIIEPLKKILRTEGKSDVHGAAKAMHICRGHFAHYGEAYGKGKLFGKYEGRYWLPQTLKGKRTAEAPAREMEIKL